MMPPLILALAMVFLSTGCGDNAAVRGVRYNTAKSDEISIGIAYPVSLEAVRNTHFAKGIEFAVNTVNRNGGVLNKRLGAVVRDDGNNANIAMQIAQTFSNQGITAVVGHWSTNVSYYTQDIYEKNRVVMLTPRSTGMVLFEEKFDYIFRMTCSNQVFAQAIALNMAERGYKNAAVYYSEDVFGNDLAKIFEKELNRRGIMVVDRVSSVTPLNISLILNRWNAFGCEGIAMAASYPDYVEPLKLIRRHGPSLPVYGGDTFESLAPDEMPGAYFDNLYIATLDLNGVAVDFLEGFRSEYGHNPDAAAIDAYEAVTLIKDAMLAVKGIGGAAIAAYISNLKDYKTVSGFRTYNPQTQELDGYSIHVRPLKSALIGSKNNTVDTDAESTTRTEP